ncbi:methionine synthase domain protein [Mycobacterium xenopi 4042]|uniref:Methionine synthase domain protein n=1 Tax=Mycobacterium xenopi 4042 TaxID=1299334 RepID=X8BGB6_MYCXE|nr:methionine synthase domain protein [Mycobacterium xenopi 4042]
MTELIAHRPPRCSKPARNTAVSVESSMIGNVDAVASRLASAVISATPSRPT